MSFRSLPRRWINAAVVFLHQRLVSQYAEQTEQNREAIYRDARQVKQQLEESEAEQTRLQNQVEKLQAEVAQLRQQAEYDPFVDPDKVAQYASQAQAEGVSLPVAQRLLKILQSSGPRRSVH